MRLCILDRGQKAEFGHRTSDIGHWRMEDGRRRADVRGRNKSQITKRETLESNQSQVIEQNLQSDQDEDDATEQFCAFGGDEG